MLSPIVAKLAPMPSAASVVSVRRPSMPCMMRSIPAWNSSEFRPIPTVSLSISDTARLVLVLFDLTLVVEVYQHNLKQIV